MTHIEVWNLALEAVRALGAHYYKPMEAAAEAHGLETPRWYSWLLPAALFAPQPLTTARLRVRAPYTAPRTFDERLLEAAQGGYLEETSHGEYQLSVKGKTAVTEVIQAAYDAMQQLSPLPQEDLQRLETLLFKLVQACLESPTPPGKWCLHTSRRIDPGEKASSLARIDQYISDLAAYRDDAHLAAWQIHKIEGHAWEAFTTLWRGEAESLDELVEKLSRRGYTRDDYAHALEDLLQRGWIQTSAGKYSLTPTGAIIRQEAEELTDVYFFKPWECLSQEELDTLRALLSRLRDNLKNK